MNLSDFAESGYCLARGVFGAAQIAGLQAAFDRTLDTVLCSTAALGNGPAAGPNGPAQRSAVPVSFRDVHCCSAAWLQALLHPEFLALAEQLVGPDVVLHHTTLLQRPGPAGGGWALHQDWGAHPTIHDTMIAACIMLTGAAGSSGAACVYPGTHRLGRISAHPGDLPETILQQYPPERATRLDAAAGDVLFLHCLLLRGWLPNHSDHSCKMLMAHVHSGDDRPETHRGGSTGALVLRGWASTSWP